MDLGKKLKDARVAAGLTQVQLANILNVEQKDISRWERNDRTPNVITFGRICEAVGASADELLEIKLKP